MHRRTAVESIRHADGHARITDNRPDRWIDIVENQFEPKPMKAIAKIIKKINLASPIWSALGKIDSIKRKQKPKHGLELIWIQVYLDCFSNSCLLLLLLKCQAKGAWLLYNCNKLTLFISFSKKKKKSFQCVSTDNVYNSLIIMPRWQMLANVESECDHCCCCCSTLKLCRGTKIKRTRKKNNNKLFEFLANGSCSCFSN